MCSLLMTQHLANFKTGGVEIRPSSRLGRRLGSVSKHQRDATRTCSKIHVPSRRSPSQSTPQGHRVVIASFFNAERFFDVSTRPGDVSQSKLRRVLARRPAMRYASVLSSRPSCRHMCLVSGAGNVRRMGAVRASASGEPRREQQQNGLECRRDEATRYQWQVETDASRERKTLVEQRRCVRSGMRNKDRSTVGAIRIPSIAMS